MEETRNRLGELIEEYSRNNISEAEFDELCEMVKEGNDAQLKMIFESGLREAPFKEMDRRKLDRMLGEVLGSRESLVVSRESGVVRKMKLWKRIVVAASIILVIGIGSYLLFNKSGKQTEIVKTESSKDVEAPKGTKAMITLANGQRVYLDSVTSGTLVNQDNVQVIKNAKGEIVYQSTVEGQQAIVQYNTLFNPRGSKVQSLTLSDGTQVWLNSESSLRYPIAFAGNERRVEITGEAYFEVSKDPTKKFIVTGNGVSTEVLGTHFNVNTYIDETSIKVTLFEGSVRVSKGNAIGLLKPGQQAQITDGIRVLNNVDLEQVMAWKNGLFQFDNASIKEIMKQVERWYDVEVIYKGSMNAKDFAGAVSRQENVSQVLKMLEATGAIRFKIDGRKITVLP